MNNLTKFSKAILAIAIMLCVALPTFAHDFEVDGIYYKYLDETAKTVKVTYRGSSYSDYSNEYTSSVTIPSSVTYNSTTYSVTSIGDNAFYYCTGLASITIPNSVTSIGDDAFENCSGLTEVNISDLSAWCKIDFDGSYANPLYYAKKLNLNGTEIKDLVIPNDITEIKKYAFYRCSGLTSIIIPNSVTSLGEYAFVYCTGLTSITIPNSVTSIGVGAFGGCSGLTSVTIPNSVTSIGDNAFVYCTGLTSITIPNSVTSIGDNAFYECSGLTSITIPNSVTEIGNNAFYGCSGLTSVTIPNSVTEIGSWAFGYCSGLTSVTIPNSVTDIGSEAFYNCTGLTSVTIPNSVTEIGNDAFRGTAWYNNLADGVIYINNVLYKYKGSMPNGTSISVKDGTVSISHSAFESCSGLTSVTIPNSVTSIGAYAFRGCTGLTKLILEDGAKSISGLSFPSSPIETLYLGRITSDTFVKGKTTLKEVSIGNSVTSIGSYAFEGCTGLTELIIEDGKETLSLGYNYYNSYYKGEGLFYDCPLEKLYIGRNLNYDSGEWYGYSPFYSKTKLKEITISNSVTSIGSWAFYGCSGLTSITIPNSVTTIGESAFCDCSLTEVNYNAENCTSMGSDRYSVFSGCSNLKIINIGSSVKTIPSYAFYRCTGLTSITIPNSVASIGSKAFYECSGLTSITIPNSVTSIGSSAFDYCTGLTEVNISDLSAWCKIDFGDSYANPLRYAKKLKLNGAEIKDLVIPNDITEIKDYAFYDCDGLTSVTIPNSVTTIGDKAFYECTGLTSVTIPNSVTSIGSYAFYDCTGLTEVNISDLSAWCKIDFSSSSANPLRYAKKLKLNGAEIKDLVIPNDITEIKDYAFYDCDGLTSVTIPNSVTTIGDKAFYECTGLTSVTIGNSVNEIGGEAFVNCGLRLIMSHCAVPPTCDGAVFGGDENNDSYGALLMIPEGSLIDYALADEWHKFTQVHEVLEAMVSIQEKNATFEIPTIEGATKYDVTVYSDITMTQLVATTHYDATGKIIPMSTTLELSIDGFEDGVYYYKVLVKSADGEVLNNYIGTFEIDAAGVENIATDNAIEVARYDIHGRLLSEPTPGINIVKMSNGTTRKEIVKN